MRQRRAKCDLSFSAHDGSSLKRQMEALSAHLVDPRVVIKMPDLSFTLFGAAFETFSSGLRDQPSEERRQHRDVAGGLG